jgi:hypothetical protein
MHKQSHNIYTYCVLGVWGMLCLGDPISTDYASNYCFWSLYFLCAKYNYNG